MRTILLVILAAATCTSVPAPGGILINDNLDYIFNFLRTGMVLEKFFEYKLGSYSASNFAGEGLVLFNVSTLIRTGDSYRYEPRVDDMTIDAAVGFSQLELRGDRFDYGGSNFAGTLVASGRNSARVRYTLYSKSKRHCRTQWEHLELEPFERIQLKAPGRQDLDGADLTQFVNDEVVTELNRYFATPDFMKKMSRDFNFCFPLPGI